MTSKKVIIQYINQLYSDNLDDFEYTARLDRLRKLGGIASGVVFDLIRHADADQKQFLFNMLGEIGDEKTIAQLRDIITNPDIDDETKLMAAVSASQIDGYFDRYLLENNLADPMELGKKVTQNMLEKSDNPIFVQSFLEDFSRMVRESQFAALEDLLPLKGDKRVVNIVAPLIEIVDDELLEYIIPILLNSHDRRAFDYLQQVIKKSDSKEIQTMARQAIFKLGTLVRDDVVAPEPLYKFYQAYITTGDGSGSSIYIFSVIDYDKKIRFIDFVSNDLLGIKDAFGGIISKKEFEQFINKVKSGIGFLTIEVPPAYFVEKVKHAEELTKHAHRSLPVEYLAFKEILKYFEHDDVSFENNQHEFKEYQDTFYKHKDEYFGRTAELYGFDEVYRSWFIDYEIMADWVQKYLSIEAKYGAVKDHDLFNKKIDELMQRTAKQILKKKFLKLLAERLNEYALLCFLGKRHERSSLAVVAAQTLFEVDPAIHPFLRQMLERSFEVYLADDDFLDEDEFDEFDEYDDFDEEEFDEFDEYDDLDDDEIRNGLNYMLPYLTPREIAGLEFRPKYPGLSRLPGIEKLKLLAQKEPESLFVEVFNPNIESLDLKSKINHVNYLESAFDNYVRTTVGDFDWDSFRRELNISVPANIQNELFQDIEEFFLTNMRGHDCGEYPLKTAQRLWGETVYLTGGKLKPMTKPYSWGAGIEMLVGAMLFSRMPMEVMEIDYQVSSSTIRKRMEQLRDILNIKVFPDPFRKYVFWNKGVPR